jgi:[acyl-carrier-protein] S-malonyltransferase
MVAILFPGQGSQRPGMGHGLFVSREAARRVFERVSDATGTDTELLCFHTDEATLRRTENAQLALFTCGMAAWECLKEDWPGTPAAFAGHSVGEYAALCAAGAIGIEACARTVKARGQIMAAAGKKAPGTMAAVLGMGAAELARLCEEVRDHGVCVVANLNGPGQVVVSGDVDAVHALSALATERGAKRVVPINVSGAFHSPLMDGPSQDFEERLDPADFAGPMTAPVYSNTTAEPVSEGPAWPSLLVRQLRSPVRWTEVMERMGADGVDTFVECGVGEVLCGLAKRILPEARTAKVVDPATLECAVVLLGGAA